MSDILRIHGSTYDKQFASLSLRLLKESLRFLGRVNERRFYDQSGIREATATAVKESGG